MSICVHLKQTKIKSVVGVTMNLWNIPVRYISLANTAVTNYQRVTTLKTASSNQFFSAPLRDAVIYVLADFVR